MMTNLIHTGKRRAVFAAALLLCLLLMLSFTVSAWADEDFEFTTISGTVKTTAGQGLEGVRVQLHSITEGKTLNAVYTDASGAWQSTEFDPIVGYTYTVSYYKEGYTFNWDGQSFTTGTGGTTLAAVTATSKLGSLSCVADDYTFTTNTTAGTSTVTKYNGSAAKVMVPAELGGYPVVAIANSAFSSKKTVTEVWLPEKVTSIGENTFNGCSKLSSVNLPNGLTSLGESCFSGCTALVSIHIPDSVTTYGAYAFSGCSALETINFPLRLSSIGYNGRVFSGCTSLTSITVPEGVTRLPDRAFSYSSLVDIQLPTSLTAIGSGAFTNIQTLTEITVPANVTSIGDNAFGSCSKLKDVDLPEGLLSLGESCFSGCTALVSIHIPDSVTTYGAYAFSGCSALETINFPLRLSSIGYNGRVFSGCTSLTSITVPEGVTRLPDRAFSYSSLVDIQLPTTLTTIGSSAFSSIQTLREITVPAHVTSIGDNAFGSCVMLKDVQLPDGLTSLGESCFSGCENLVSLHVPDSVTTFGAYVFSGCLKLRNVNFPLMLSSLGYNNRIFSNTPALRTITVPEGVTALPNNMFNYASGLVTVYLPSTLKTVGESAFSNCSSLRHVALPSGVTSVGQYAFSNCPQMESLVVYAMSTQFADNSVPKQPLLTIYGWNNADAILYAIRNDIPFELLGENGDYSGYLADMTATSLSADAQTVEDGQTVAFTLQYTLRTPLPENLADTRLTVALSSTLAAQLDSVRLNGSAVADATLSGSTLTVPVSAAATSGTLTFSATSSGTTGSAMAQLLYTIGGTQKADTIGTLELDGGAFQGGYHYVLLSRDASAVSVLFRNGSMQETSVMSALAVYGEDGHMLACTLQPVTLSAGAKTTLSLAIPNGAQAVTVKAFTLAPATLAPLSAAWSYSLAG